MNAPRTRVQRRPVHGVLLLDKPLGLSSNQALQKAKWLLRAEKAGHTGTLDPLATVSCPCVLVRPPSSVSSIWMPTRLMRPWCAWV
jgi:tRNA U55 pseudouridine synthase TruB